MRIEGPYPFKTLERRINGKEVSIVGVLHVKPFFVAYEEYFDTVIQSHDAVVLEQPVGGEFWQQSFFKYIGKLARKHKTKVYLADPTNLATHDSDKIYGYLGILMMVAKSGELLVRQKMQKLSRRNFLKCGLWIGGGVSLALGSFDGLMLRGRMLGLDHIADFGWDDILLHGETDYRNIKIAEGLIKICDEVKDIKNLVAIHGQAHSEPIAEYIESPVLRKKLYTYFPYELVGKTKVREYTPTKKGWNLVRRF